MRTAPKPNEGSVPGHVTSLPLGPGVLPPGRPPAFQGTTEGPLLKGNPTGEALSVALGSEVTSSPQTKWEEGQLLNEEVSPSSLPHAWAQRFGACTCDKHS